MTRVIRGGVTLAVLFGLALGPAVARAKSPATKPAPAGGDKAPTVDGDVTEGWVNGMKVLVKQVPGAEFVAARLIVRGGVRNWGPTDAGIEQLALAVATRGGAGKLDKDAFARKLAQMGSAIFGSSEDDFSTLGASGPREGWDDLFAMLVDCFRAPAMPASELEVQRQSQLVRLKREMEQPDQRLRLLARKALFTGHPFINRPIGTVENVQRFDAAALGAHLAKLRQTSRLVLVVVGDVQASRVLEQARAAFAGVPRGDYQDVPLPPIQFDKARLITDEKKLATNYIQAMFPGPRWSDPEYVTAMVAMDVLHEREWDEVRTKRNLSYAPSAGFASGGSIPLGYLYVTAVDPPTTMKVMLDEARRLRSEPVPAKELAGDKSVFLTGLLMASETMDGQAGMLARNEVLGGSWRRVRSLPDAVRAVSPEAVQAFARKWIGRWQTLVLGNAASLPPDLFEKF